MPYTQWGQLADGAGYAPVGKTSAEIAPGYYDITIGDGVLYFMPVRARTDDLLEFPDSKSKEVIEGIETFWDREKVFRKYGLAYKRGILLYGPPGSGKTCTLQIISREVVNRGGVVISFSPATFLRAYRAFRDIQPDTHMVVLMEDFESLIKNSETTILNLLDGVESLDKVVFLATSNYPELLQARIVNRPSRFDLVVRVPHPDHRARTIYLQSLLQPDDTIDLEQYVKDTEAMSLAHVKELFVATVVLGQPYKMTVQRLKDMAANKPTSLEDEEIDTKGMML
jgi:SpoVK/Ycf46/Vps4 family AAA+-type ATPase